MADIEFKEIEIRILEAVVDAEVDADENEAEIVVMIEGRRRKAGPIVDIDLTADIDAVEIADRIGPEAQDGVAFDPRIDAGIEGAADIDARFEIRQVDIHHITGAAAEAEDQHRLRQHAERDRIGDQIIENLFDDALDRDVERARLAHQRQHRRKMRAVERRLHPLLQLQTGSSWADRPAGHGIPARRDRLSMRRPRPAAGRAEAAASFCPPPALCVAPTAERPRPPERRSFRDPCESSPWSWFDTRLRARPEGHCEMV